MKKIISLLLCAVLLAALFTGCQTKENPADPDVTDPVTDAQPTPEPTVPDEGQPDIAPAETREVTLYLPNDNADGFDEKTVTVAEDPQAILTALTENGALPEGMTFNSFELQDDQAHIIADVSSHFQEVLQSTGTAGETMYMGSFINTLLKAYNAKTITVTCDGKIIETGHAVYDQPLEFCDLTAGQ